MVSFSVIGEASRKEVLSGWSPEMNKDVPQQWLKMKMKVSLSPPSPSLDFGKD